MKTFTPLKAYVAFIFFFVFINSVTAQNTQVAVIREWVQHFAKQDSIMQSPAIHDAHGNYFVAGYTYSDSNGADIAVRKYDNRGNVVWSDQFYQSSCHCADYATAVALDTSNNLYVAGVTYTDSTNGFDMVIIKYNILGGRTWTQYYNNSNYTGGYDVPVAIAWYNGKVYVTGTSQDSTGVLDIVTLSLDAGTGSIQATAKYDYVHLMDVPRAMTAGSAGIIITGGSQNSYLDWDYISLKYDRNLNLVHTTRVTNSGNSFDRANAVALTGLGTAYITGRAFVSGSDYDMRTVKIDSTGSMLWVVDYDYNGLMDEANSIAVDADENIYITGYGTVDSVNKDFITIKYDSSGTLQWVKYYDGPRHANDIAWDIALDGFGTVYVTGESFNGYNSDFCTVAYQTSDGLLLWKDIYDGSGHCNDRATHVECDSAGIVYVSGQACINDSTYEYVAIRYYSRHVLIPPGDNINDTPTSVGYYTNYGQIVDTDDSVRTDIKFYSINHYPNLYFFEPDSTNDYNVMSYVFSHVDNDTTTNDTLHRVDLTFENYDGENYEPIIEKTHALPVDKSEGGLMNYYLHQCPDGIIGVEGYQRISYTEAFFKTDIQFYGNGSGMKMYIIAKPDGVSGVNLKFTGQDSLIITDSTLAIVTSIGSYTYDRPQVFQIDSLGNRQNVSWTPTYVDLDSGRVGFYLQSFYTDMPLVIEVERYVPETPPSCTQNNLQWSALLGTFNGMAMDNTSDANGNVFVCGNTWNANTMDFPIHNASQIQPTFGGGLEDCFIAKFLPTNSTLANAPFNNLKWCTYYGGPLREYASSIALNNNGDVYVVGETEGSLPTNLLVSSPTGNFNHNTFQGGSNDGFILKIDDNPAVPTLVWSSYIGGSGIDYPMQVAVNQNLSSPNYGHVYVVGETFSTTGFPLQSSSASVNSYNQTSTPVSGNYDAFIMRFDGSDNLDWSSYYGGNQFTAFGSIAIASDDKVLIGGFTRSTNPNVPTSAGVQTAANANSSGVIQLAYPSGSPYFDGSQNGFIDALLVSFNVNDELIWATYFGGSVDEEIYSNNIAVSGTNFYVLGITDSPPGTPPGSDFPLHSGSYYQNTYGGGSADCFIAEFKESDFGQNWTTYFGGSGNEGFSQWTPGGGPGTGAIAVDNATDIVYIAGNTTSSSSSSSCAALSNGDFPLCNSTCFNSYNCTFSGTNGYPDAFVAAFSGTDLIWSTYLGADNSCITGLNVSGTGSTWLNFVSSNTTTFVTNYAFPTFASISSPYIFYNNSTISPNQLPPVDGRFDISCITGINDANTNQSDDFLVYPNPAQSELNLSFNLENSSALAIGIYDAIGRVIYTTEIKGNKGLNKFSLSLTGIPESIYFVQLKTKDFVKGKKVIVEK